MLKWLDYSARGTADSRRFRSVDEPGLPKRTCYRDANLNPADCERSSSSRPLETCVQMLHVVQRDVKAIAVSSDLHQITTSRGIKIQTSPISRWLSRNIYPSNPGSVLSREFWLTETDLAGRRFRAPEITRLEASHAVCGMALSSTEEKGCPNHRKSQMANVSGCELWC